MIPAVVTAWDPSIQRADCRPLVKQAYVDESGERQVESLPIVPGVAVQFPGGGGYRLTVPISDGNTVIDGAIAPATTGMLIFAERSIDKWLSGSGQEVDPEIDHSHQLSDAVFVPGLNPFQAALASCPGDHMTVGADGGVQSHYRKNIIAHGDESGNDFVALAQKVLDQLDAIQTAFSGHVHGPGTYKAGSVAILGTSDASPTYSPGSVAASQVKAK